jgi:hypothetical protein
MYQRDMLLYEKNILDNGQESIKEIDKGLVFLYQ